MQFGSAVRIYSLNNNPRPGDLIFQEREGIFDPDRFHIIERYTSLSGGKNT